VVIATLTITDCLNTPLELNGLTENAGHEIAGHENTGHEFARHDKISYENRLHYIIVCISFKF